MRGNNMRPDDPDWGFKADDEPQDDPNYVVPPPDLDVNQIEPDFPELDDSVFPEDES
jgi:hypothetical protein